MEIQEKIIYGLKNSKNNRGERVICVLPFLDQMVL